jgi:sugar phosphate isomerase/epimerase
MRLGGTRFRPETVAELDAMVETFDVYGLSAIVAPLRIEDMSDEEAVRFGDRSEELGLVIGEAHYLVNLMTRDPVARDERITRLRALLRKADLMRARCVLGFAGSASPIDDIGVPDAYNFSEAFKAEFREIVIEVLDGLELNTAKFLLEANPKAFFYGPEAIAECIRGVGHPNFGVHLDQMNMVDQHSYFDTTDLINRTFDLLADHIGAVHMKDIRWDWDCPMNQFLKFDEVLIGDGVLDYHTFFTRLSQLDPDLPCICEHLETEGEYAINFARVRHIAAEVGAEFVGRHTTDPAG